MNKTAAPVSTELASLKTAADIAKAIQANKALLENRSADDNRVATFGDAAKPSEFARQGDIYAIYYGAEVGNCWKKIEAPSGLQLAPGNNPGSRHILSHGNGVTFYEVNFKDTPDPKNPSKKMAFEPTLVGMAFKTEKRVTITHPEHDHIDLAPGVYIITFQREATDVSAFRRVLD